MTSSPLTVLYDADCGICTQTARLLTRLDSRRRLRLVPLQSPLPGRSAPPRAVLEDALHAVDGRGRWFVGAAAGVEIARRVPLLWPLSLFARIPVAKPVLDSLYRAVADNRLAIGRFLGLGVCRVPRSEA